jgi:hypothetical protein
MLNSKKEITSAQDLNNIYPAEKDNYLNLVKKIILKIKNEKNVFELLYSILCEKERGLTDETPRLNSKSRATDSEIFNHNKFKILLGYYDWSQNEIDTDIIIRALLREKRYYVLIKLINEKRINKLSDFEAIYDGLEKIDHHDDINLFSTEFKEYRVLRCQVMIKIFEKKSDSLACNQSDQLMLV